jgi:DNA-binding NarL/FixJ family response regulator
MNRSRQGQGYWWITSTGQGDEGGVVDETKAIRVLIADDSAPVRERLADLLSDVENVEVVGAAADATEVQADIQALHPDVVILDVQMPAGSGISVLRWAQHEPVRPKFIMLTNFPYAQYRKTCLEAGASYFFDKSSEFDKIPQALEQLTSGAPS